MEVKKVKKEQLDFSSIDRRALPAFMTFLILAAVGLSYFFYLRKSREEKYNDEKISVATSIFPFYDIAKNIVGDNSGVEVNYIIPVGTDPALYEVDESGKEKITNSDLSFFVGVGLDDSLSILAGDSKVDLSAYVGLTEEEEKSESVDLVKVCAGNGGTWLADYHECVNLSEQVCGENLGKYDSCASSCRHEPDAQQCITVCVPLCQFDSDSYESTSKTTNPYYWLSIENSKTIAQVIYKEIAKKKPQYSFQFAQNYENYVQSLDEARTYISEQSKLVDDRRVLVLTDTSDYFLTDYDFEVQTRLGGKDLKDIQKAADKYNSRIYLKDEFYSDENITNYLLESGARTVTIKTIGGEGQELNYIDLMRSNIDSLVSSYGELEEYRFIGRDLVAEFNLKNTNLSILNEKSQVAELELSDLPDSIGTSFENYLWTGPSSFAVETHVNPSYGELYFYEIKTEGLEYIKRYLGADFTLSPSGEKVAYIGQIVHFSDFASQDINFMVNDEILYTKSGDQFLSKAELFSNISWSDESTVQFRDWSNEGELKIIVAE
ncbi:MAG: metal ABC transporter substrate-binding protein [Candidatus Dojkabacteria bacterium]|nr:metal ABC transporter substrate-binding protein [Candidatus Dojkabacteria bacterium]